MHHDLSALMGAYLDGELSAEHTLLLERRMHEPMIQRALAEELALRDWLRHVGPDAPPEHLSQQLEAAVVREAKQRANERAASVLTTVWGTMSAMTWMARGPLLVVAGPSGAPTAGQAARGLGTALLSRVVSRSIEAPRKKARPSVVRRLGALTWKLVKRP